MEKRRKLNLSSPYKNQVSNNEEEKLAFYRKSVVSSARFSTLISYILQIPGFNLASWARMEPETKVNFLLRNPDTKRGLRRSIEVHPFLFRELFEKFISKSRFDKDDCLNLLMEKFYNGTISNKLFKKREIEQTSMDEDPLLKNAKEKCRTTTFFEKSHSAIEVCNTIIWSIFSYLPPNRRTLDRIGCVCKNFHSNLILSWNEIRVGKGRRMMEYPLEVLKSVRNITLDHVESPKNKLDCILEKCNNERLSGIRILCSHYDLCRFFDHISSLTKKKCPDLITFLMVKDLEITLDERITGNATEKSISLAQAFPNLRNFVMNTKKTRIQNIQAIRGLTRVQSSWNNLLPHKDFRMSQSISDLVLTNIPVTKTDELVDNVLPNFSHVTNVLLEFKHLNSDTRYTDHFRGKIPEFELSKLFPHVSPLGEKEEDENRTKPVIEELTILSKPLVPNLNVEFPVNINLFERSLHNIRKLHIIRECHDVDPLGFDICDVIELVNNSTLQNLQDFRADVPFFKRSLLSHGCRDIRTFLKEKVYGKKRSSSIVEQIGTFLQIFRPRLLSESITKFDLRTTFYHYEKSSGIRHDESLRFQYDFFGSRTFAKRIRMSYSGNVHEGKMEYSDFFHASSLAYFNSTMSQSYGPRWNPVRNITEFLERVKKPCCWLFHVLIDNLFPFFSDSRWIDAFDIKVRLDKDRVAKKYTEYGIRSAGQYSSKFRKIIQNWMEEWKDFLEEIKGNCGPHFDRYYEEEMFPDKIGDNDKDVQMLFSKK